MAAPVLMPKLGLTMETGTVISWRVSEGDRVEAGQVVAEIETDKITSDVEAPVSGVLLKIRCAAGDEARVMDPIAYVGEPGETLASTDESAVPDADAQSSDTGPGEANVPAAPRPTEAVPVRVSPRAKRLMKEHGLTVAELGGVGVARITEQTVRDHLDRSGGDTAQSGGRRVALSRTQAVVASRMAESASIPQFSIQTELPMDLALALRERRCKETGQRISVNDVVVKACIMTLAAAPELQLVYRDDHLWAPDPMGIGIAVDTDEGLVVPVINPEAKAGLVEIALESARLIGAAKDGTLTANDVAGAIFTVTNLGMYGVTSFVPLVPPGQSSILGLGAIRGTEGADPSTMTVTLACDHRAVNGAVAARFLSLLGEAINSEEMNKW